MKLDLIPATTLREDDTLRDALKVIEDNSWKIVVITDRHGKMAGIVSAGDLRKSLLHGHSVASPLRGVMNRKPVSLTVKNRLDSPKNFHHLFDDLKRRYGNSAVLYALIPVTTKDKKILGLISLGRLTTEEARLGPSYGRRVLVVGGAGYIGSVLTRELIQNGWRVRVLDKLLYTKNSLNGLPREKFTLIKGDAHNIDTLVKAVEEVDAVVYLAELVGDPACSLAPQTTLKTNYLAVNSIAHLCSHLNINRFVYVSSCSTYGASKNIGDLLTEESPLEPVSLYARMKVLVEQSILLVRHLPNPLFAPTILRLGTVFGYSYRPRFDLVVNTFVKNAWQNGKIEVKGGDQWRPNVHVSDVARAILTVLEAPVEKVRGQIFNVGSNANNHTINDLADFVKKVFPSVKILKRKKAVDKRNYRVDFSKIEKTLGFKAKISVQEGMFELKRALEQNGFATKDLDESRFNNMKRLKELNLA